jgi:hypothetical protein
MSPLLIAAIVFACTFASTLVAMWISRSLPQTHISPDSKDAVKQGLTLIATLTALVLGLLVATTKGTYDAQSGAIRELSATVVLLDRMLIRYGPKETEDARVLLRKFVRIFQAQLWPAGGSQPADQTEGDVRPAGEAFFDKVAELEPKTDAQRLLKSRALETAIGVGQLRQRLLAQKESSIPVAFLVVLTFWLIILFAGFGLLAPRNATVLTVLIVCMLSVAGAIFLVLELDRPFTGIVRITDAPLQAAISRLDEIPRRQP